MEPHIKSSRKSKIYILLITRMQKIFISCFIALGVAIGLPAAFAHYIESVTCEVTLNDDGHSVQVVTMEETVDDFLKKHNIVLAPNDEIKPDVHTKLDDGTVIEITRAFKVNIAVDNQLKEICLTEGAVRDVLKKAKVTLRGMDLINYGLDEKVLPGTLIKITRIDEVFMIEKESIPYQVINKKNPNVDEGVQRIVEQGKQGELQKKILVAYRNGIEVSRKLVEETITQQPVDRIVEIGTARSLTTSRGDKIHYSKVETFRATAYTHTGNRTRTGIWPEEGIIAVDPKVIPLYSTVYIEFPGSWSRLNGLYRAMDVGGTVKGNTVDVFMNERSACFQFGRKNVKIYFIK